jgi:fibronectin-binding autotransporter adhesin
MTLPGEFWQINLNHPKTDQPMHNHPVFCQRIFAQIKTSCPTMKTLHLTAALTALLVANSTALASNIWNGGGDPDGNWSNAANWGGAAPSYGTLLTFGGTAALNSTNNSQTASVVGFTFSSGAGAFVINGSDVTLGGNIINNSTSTETINLNLALSANRTVTLNSGPVVLGGAITGAFSLIKAGATYPMTLNSAASSYSTFQINSGPAILGVNNAIPTAATLVLAATTSVDLNGHSQTLGQLTFGGTSGTGTVSDSIGGGWLTLGGSVIQNPTGVAGAVSVPVDINAGNRIFNIQNSANTVTFSGMITNSTVSGALTKNGAGTLILSGTNTYKGNTIVNAGTLQLNVACLSSTASVSISNGAALNLTFTSTNVVGAIVTNGVAVSPGVYSSNTLPGLITGSGSLKVLTLVSLGIWDGGGADAKWSTAANWDNDVAPVLPISLTFAGSTGLLNTNDLTSATVTGIAFDAAAGAFVISGNAITNAGGISFNGNPASPITQTLNLNMDLGGANRTITTQTNGNILLGGVISGNGTLFKNGPGTLTLAAVNTFTNSAVPNVQVRGGTLKIGVNEAVPMQVTLDPTTGNTSTLDLNGKTQTTSLAVAGTAGAAASAAVIDSAGGGLLKLNSGVAMNAGAATIATISANMDLNGGGRGFTINDSAQTMTISGAITDSVGGAGLIKLGAGSLVIAGAYAYNGKTVIDGGTLQLNSASLSATNALYLTNTAVLKLTFSTTNAIGVFYTNGVALAAGVYNAGNLPGLIAGDGSLQTTQAPASNPGNPASPVVSGGSLTFNITNSTGTYIIEATTNIALPGRWVGIYTNTAPFTFTDTNAVNLFPQRFYRSVTQ